MFIEMHNEQMQNENEGNDGEPDYGSPEETGGPQDGTSAGELASLGVNVTGG
jgi:hypothetical protein